jgi:hypothetical protein
MTDTTAPDHRGTAPASGAAAGSGTAAASAVPHPFPSLLDHVVIAGPDLPGVIAWFQARTGVHALKGGTHPSGTANALVALTREGVRGPQYIELIGPAPDRQDPAVPSTFGIADLTGPQLAAYAIHPEDIAATVDHAREAGYDPGDVEGLSRVTPDGTELAWHLTRSDNAAPGVPFLIDWDESPHPGLSDLPALELVSFTTSTSEPESLRRRLATLGLGEDAVAAVEQSEEDGTQPADAGTGSASGAEIHHHLTVRRADGRIVEL